MLKLIKTPEEYRTAIQRVRTLISSQPAKATREFEELEILAVLIEDYERAHFEIPAVGAIEAIRFRMDQLDLGPKDLVPFLGSKSRVSEVLAGKRPLTLPMIRALSEGLGIPASSLINEDQRDTVELDWSRFPVRELIKRGLIKAKADFEGLAHFIPPSLLPGLDSNQELAPVHFRGPSRSTDQTIDHYALATWVGLVLREASRMDSDLPTFEASRLTPAYVKKLVQLSTLDTGPVEAIDSLRQLGIVIVVVPSLPRTRVDGLATINSAGRPVIGLSIRHDRLDNFWYTLLHELGHVVLHLAKGRSRCFVDDLDIAGLGDLEESEADEFASETLIPTQEWLASPASKLRAAPAVIALASDLGINPALVAGRIRYQYRDFRVLSGLVGQGAVRPLFPNTLWPSARR